ncbi:MAG TPA: DUF5916 domain-containing protein [Kofleriaceae bacterium]|jgi:hypothetical protein
MLRLAAALVLASGAVAWAQGPAPTAHAVRRTCEITIDGALDEPCWKTAPKQSGFVQRFPTFGVKPDHDTSFAVMFDDSAIYIGVWADDDHPELIRALLTRRDIDGVEDAVIVGFDSYHDKRTAYAFQLDAAGVQRDVLLYDDTNQDDTWDAVWTGDAKITAHGWTAEYRIPLNQLRYAGGEPLWGLQVVRNVGRTQEQSTWSPWPRDTPQIVSKFGTLDGVDLIHTKPRLELLPYATGGFDAPPGGTGDPLNSKTVPKGGVGLDLKYGLGPAFTLSASINPDFGQVEQDPSAVNLSPNQLFFAEKRPFFLEGTDLFKLYIGNSDGGPEGQFYSRRIGAAPDIPNVAYNYVQAPDATTIYGAAKLTGKTPSGWSVGVLDAVTGGESVDYVDLNNVTVHPVVAVPTNYLVGRVKKDVEDGQVSLGASFTAVDRALDNSGLAESIADQAYTAGAQIQSRWGNNAWVANASFLSSYVHGSEDAIAALQETNRHLWQRPDATDVSYDPTRTSMDGFGLSYKIGRFGDTKHWSFTFGGDLRSPGLELNDVGYQNSSDRYIPFLWGQYHENTPSAQLLNWSVSADVFSISNFEPTLEGTGFESNGNVQFSNYWSMGYYYNLQSAGWDPVALRGGPMLRTNPTTQTNVFIQTDPRSKLVLTANGNGSWDWTADAIQGEIDLTATLQARSNLDLSLGPTFMERNDPMQYVGQATDTDGALHYITAAIHQVTAAMTIRLDWTFSPHLTLQAYAQPFVGTGRYYDYKDVDNPHAAKFGDRFHVLGGNQIAEANDIEYADYNGFYSFDRPDFAFLQLRSTVVLRWEYRPGSTVFVIWNHGRTNSLDDGRFLPGHDFSELATDTPGDNVVMLKANYWIGL